VLHKKLLRPDFVEKSDDEIQMENPSGDTGMPSGKVGGKGKSITGKVGGDIEKDLEIDQD
jgi:hypothetical protein